MAFRSARVNSNESESGGSSPTMESNSSESSTGGASGVPATSAAAESQFDIAAEGTGATLQRLAKQHGSERVHSWVDEGMPVETMGKARSMDEFRERQANRPPEVPTDVEQQNEASLHRSKKAQHDTAAAGDAGVPSSVRDVISSPGGDLDGEVKSGLEDRLGSSLDHVQVHTGPKAQEACQEVNARAFAVGNHIAFGPGEYDPSSPEGQHLIAHEVVHTLQQPDAAMSMMPKTQVDMEIDPDPQAEREADQVADQVLKGDQVGIDGMWNTDVHVQRAEKYSRREFFQGEPSLEETAEAADEVADSQRLLEQVVSEAADIDWVSVFKKAALGAAKTNAVSSAMLSAADEIDGQVRSDAVDEDTLITHLDQRDPPESWVPKIAEQAADMIRSGHGGNFEGLA